MSMKARRCSRSLTQPGALHLIWAGFIGLGHSTCTFVPCCFASVIRVSSVTSVRSLAYILVWFCCLASVAAQVLFHLSMGVFYILISAVITCVAVLVSRGITCWNFLSTLRPVLLQLLWGVALLSGVEAFCKSCGVPTGYFCDGGASCPFLSRCHLCTSDESAGWQVLIWSVVSYLNLILFAKRVKLSCPRRTCPSRAASRCA